MPDRSPPFGVLVVPSPHALSDRRTSTPRPTASAWPATPPISRSASARSSPRCAPATTCPPAELLVNDLEAAARSLVPDIEAALADVRAAGAAVALVCGSGPTVFGLYPGIEGPALAAAAAADLAGRHPGAAVAMPVDATFAAVREEEGVAA